MAGQSVLACFQWIPCVLGRHRGVGVPSLLQGGHSIPAMAAGVLHALDHHQRKEFEGTQRVLPVAADLSPPRPLARGGPQWGWCQALCHFPAPFLGPSAHLLAFRTADLLNGSLCAPQELAPKSPDRNAGQRCLLWIQA